MRFFTNRYVKICAVSLFTMALIQNMNINAYATEKNNTSILQEKSTVKGTVIDQDGIPIPGVTVMVKGKPTLGTSTDIDGNYALTVEPTDILVFTSIGYRTAEQRINGQTNIHVRMEEESIELEEVVAVGYGTQTKRDLTGSIASVKGDEVNTNPASNAMSGVQGKVAGVSVATPGTPGATPQVRIRGVGSIQNSNPLYVVDGIFTQNIDFVNPSDIESMEILKDPSSLAMFGVQGANGVIIVTTKRAKAGETRVTFDSYVGSQYVPKNMYVPLTNGDQFRNLYNQNLANQNQPAYDFVANNETTNTDWQDAAFKQGIISNNNISFASSSDKNKLLFSAGYFTQQSVYKYDDYNRFTARLNDEFILNKSLKVGADVTISSANTTNGKDGLDQALRAAPVFTPQNEYGEWNATPSFQSGQIWNPTAMQQTFEGTKLTDDLRLLASAYAELTFLKDFTFRTSFYADVLNTSEREYTPAYDIGGQQTNSLTAVRQKEQVSQSLQWDNILTYKKYWGDNALTLLGGMTGQYSYLNWMQGNRSGIYNDIPNNPDYWYISIGADDPTQKVTGQATDASFISFLFRANYGYKDRYLFTVSVREDGSSKFAPDNRWGTFPAFGAGWVISDEPWMTNITEKSSMDFFKIKVSWGMLGNDKIGDYLYYPVQGQVPGGIWGDGDAMPGLYPSYLLDPYISWEVTQGTDVGFESAWLNNRFTFGFTYFNKVTKDLLVEVPVPATTGYTTMLTNAGSVRNNGTEITLGWFDKINNDWSYGLNANFTTLNNEVLSLGDNPDYAIYGGIGNVTKTAVGTPIGAFYGYKAIGVWQTQEQIDNNPSMPGAKPGDLIYADVNGDGVIDENDRTYLGSPIPKFSWGIAPSVAYKNWDLSFLLEGATGAVVYSAYRQSTYTTQNYTTNRLDAWTGPGTSNSEYIMDNSRGNNYVNSSYYAEDASYFRIRNIQLGYTFNKDALNKIKMQRLRVYFNMDNVYTLQHTTSYNTTIIGKDAFDQGINTGATKPVPAVYTFGLNAIF